MIEQTLLHQKYVEEGLPIRRIASELGVSPGQVRYWLAQYNIPRRGVGFGALTETERKALQRKGGATARARAGPRRFLVTKEELARLYQDEELSLQQIADRFQVSTQTVLNRMVKEGIPTRDNDTAKRLRRRDPDVSRRASLARRGRKSHLWKGGRTPLYKQVRTCLKMKSWRRGVFERDNFTCRTCGKRGGTLHADHVRGMATILVENGVSTLAEAEALEELWDVANGRTLCVGCHRKTPSYGQQLRCRDA